GAVAGAPGGVAGRPRAPDRGAGSGRPGRGQSRDAGARGGDGDGDPRHPGRAGRRAARGRVIPPAAYDVGALRRDQFPITRRWAYLDNGTFGPLPRAAVDAAAAWTRSLSEGARLPVPWSDEIERVRGLAARLYGCPAEDVAFLKSSAEGRGLVALGLEWRAGDEVVVPEAEFPSGVLAWLGLERLGIRVRFVRLAGRHRFDAADVEELLSERTRVVSLGLVNFGNGFR